MVFDLNLLTKFLAALGVASVVGFVAGLAWGWLRQALGDLSTTSSD